jgi:CRP-like cAMP-binding protein
MPDMKISEILGANPLFHGLAPEHLAFLARCSRPESLRRNAILFHENQPARTFYLLRSGRITVEVPAIEGPAMHVQTLEPGEVVGWSWLIPPYRWNFQGRVEADTELIAFDGDLIRERCETDHDFGYRLVRDFAELMSRRLEAARLRLMAEWSPAGFA